MKKIIIYVFFMLILFTSIGCTDISKITISTESVEIDIDEEIIIKPIIEGITSYELFWVSEDENIATVDDGLVTGKSPGEVRVNVSLKSDTTVFDSVVIKVKERLSASLESTTLDNKTIENGHLLIDDKIRIKTTLLSITNNELIYESSDPNIALVSKDGIVTAVGSGEAFITIRTKEKSTITNAFLSETIKLIVEKEEEEKPNVEIIYEGDTTIYQNYKLECVAHITPDTVSQEYTITTTSDLIKIDGKVITGISEGLAIITLTSLAYPDVSINVEIKVVRIKDECTNDYLFKPYNIVIMGDKELIEEYDKTFEKLTGQFTITFKELPDNTDLVKAINNGLDCDFILSKANDLPDLVRTDKLLSIDDIYNRFGASVLRDRLSYSKVNSKLYNLLLLNEDYQNISLQGFYYDTDLIKSLGLEDPAELYCDNKWNEELFLKWCAEAGKVTKKVISSKEIDLFKGLVNASGVTLFDMNSGKVTLDDEICTNAYTLLSKLKEESYLSDSEGLLYSGDISYVNGKVFDDGTVGYVPYPSEERYLTLGNCDILVPFNRLGNYGISDDCPDNQKDYFTMIVNALLQYQNKVIEEKHNDVYYNRYKSIIDYYALMIENSSSIQIINKLNPQKLLFEHISNTSLQFDESFTSDFSSEEEQFQLAYTNELTNGKESIIVNKINKLSVSNEYEIKLANISMDMLTYKSTNEKCAVVSKDGIVSALNPGEVRILVLDDDILIDSLYIEVTSNKEQVDEIIVNGYHEMTLGETQYFDVHINPETALQEYYVVYDKTLFTYSRTNGLTAIKTGRILIYFYSYSDPSVYVSFYINVVS